MKPMSVTKDVNLGTLLPLLVWALGASVGGIWWASGLTNSVNEVRAWQVRQDSRLGLLEDQQALDNAHNARLTALLEVIQREVHRNNELLLEELRQRHADEERTQR